MDRESSRPRVYRECKQAGVCRPPRPRSGRRRAFWRPTLTVASGGDRLVVTDAGREAGIEDELVAEAVKRMTR